MCIRDSIHSDHFNFRTVRTLDKERPTLRWGCCDWLVRSLLEAGVDKRRIDVLEPGKEVVYPEICYLTPEVLAHNVPNCGYHITVMGGESLFYACLLYTSYRKCCRVGAIEKNKEMERGRKDYF